RLPQRRVDLDVLEEQAVGGALVDVVEGGAQERLGLARAVLAEDAAADEPARVEAGPAPQPRNVAELEAARREHRQAAQARAAAALEGPRAVATGDSGVQVDGCVARAAEQLEPLTSKSVGRVGPDRSGVEHSPPLSRSGRARLSN